MLLQRTLELCSDSVWQALSMSFSKPSSNLYSTNDPCKQGQLLLLLRSSNSGLKNCECRLPDPLTDARKNRLKVASKLVKDFLGCVNLSKLKKQGNLA